MTIELTYDEAVELLQEAVAKKGEDYVYEPPLVQTPYIEEGSQVALCVYFDDEGSPSCIVGHALAKKGVTREALDNVDSELNRNAGPYGLESAEVISAPVGVIDLLSLVQDYQDQGTPWGEALRIATNRRNA
jgi:hypothetical protein